MLSKQRVKAGRRHR